MPMDRRLAELHHASELAVGDEIEVDGVTFYCRDLALPEFYSWGMHVVGKRGGEAVLCHPYNEDEEQFALVRDGRKSKVHRVVVIWRRASETERERGTE